MKTSITVQNGDWWYRKQLQQIMYPKAADRLWMWNLDFHPQNYLELPDPPMKEDRLAALWCELLTEIHGRHERDTTRTSLYAPVVPEKHNYLFEITAKRKMYFNPVCIIVMLFRMPYMWGEHGMVMPFKGRSSPNRQTTAPAIPTITGGVLKPASGRILEKAF